MQKLIYSVLAIMLAVTVNMNAEDSKPIPERKVTISFTDERISIILDSISTQAGFHFSYSPTALPLAKKLLLIFGMKQLKI